MTAVFAELLAHPGVEEICHVRSRFGLMAFHGGNLEKETDRIATAVADRTGASLYAVVQPPDLRWHIPSTAVQPSASERLAAFLDHVDVTIALHGYGREGYWTTLLLGGRNRALATHVRDALTDHIGPHGFDAVDDLDAIPETLRGVHPANPVNLARNRGVQLELPPRIRGTSPLSQPGYVESLIDGLTAAVATWPMDDHGESRTTAQPPEASRS